MPFDFHYGTCDVFDVLGLSHVFLCFSYKTREYPNALQACHKYDGESFANITELSLYPHSNGRLAKYDGNPFIVGSLPPLNNNKALFHWVSLLSSTFYTKL